MKAAVTGRILRCARVAAFALAVALSGGCSMLKTTYNNADWLTLMWLERYVEMDAVQEGWAKGRIREFLQWHRHDELPEYVRFLERAETLVRGPVTAADVLALNAEVSARLDAAVAKALPDMAQVALEVTPAQIAYMERKFQKNNATFTQEYLDITVEERQEARFKTVIWMAEYLYGSLSDEQKETLRRASYARPLVNEAWLAERLGRQRDLLAVLKRIRAEKPPADVVVRLLREQAVRATGIAAIPDPATREAALEASRQAAQLSAMTMNLATPEQKERAIKSLRRWARDLRTLSREPRL